MKKTLFTLALATVAPIAFAQTTSQSTTTTTGANGASSTTTTTTEGSGTITEYSPGSSIVLKETSGPRTYHMGKTVTYVDRSGKVLDPDVVRTRIKVGVPVHVHYTGSGDDMMVDRVIVDQD